MGDELFTPDEVADYLHVTRTVVYRWLRAGNLKGIRVGRHWRIRSSDLDDFLKVEKEY
jgi:excisionase family DNA binding protein